MVGSRILQQLLGACLLWTVALANVEKVIFSAPPSISHTKIHVSELAGTLSPANLRIRTKLPIAFPTEESPRGIESWVKLEDLNPGARYEVRICWLATVSNILLSLFYFSSYLIAMYSSKFNCARERFADIF